MIIFGSGCIYIQKMTWKVIKSYDKTPYPQNKGMKIVIRFANTATELVLAKYGIIPKNHYQSP